MRLEDYVRAAAERDPNWIAVRCNNSTLTYGELDQLADRQAAALLAAGVQPGDRVVLWADKSVAAVALTQAVLRIGACYVPLGPANPFDRVRRIAENCAAAAIVYDAVALEVIESPGIPVLELDWLGTVDPRPIDRHTGSADEPAYILYTSGSTGEPKGVVLSHHNAMAFVDWAVEEVGVRSTDRLANHAPFNFDLSVFDLYAAFRAGASVTLIPSELAYAPAQLVALLKDEQITIWYSVPSAVILMMDRGGLLDDPQPSALRTCIVAGEPMPIDGVHRFRAALPAVRMFNWYGPTETNVCTSYEVRPADMRRTAALPIGTAAAGDTVLLDRDAQIEVSGPTVMLGYWGRPPHVGPYRTGDIGRLDADGNLEYVGRIDDMAKVRGHRVEPVEIEAVLGRHPGITAVLVVVRGSGLEAELHAVVVAAPDAEPPSLLELKRRCAQHLPRYMIVDAVHVWDSLPRNQNGKLDRRAVTRSIQEKSYGRT